MGKRLDALLGRGFKTPKFKATSALAVSRLAVLKNQRQARCSVARSDVVEFLKTSNQERALLRVEQVIKEQNMLDVFVVLEGYCHLLMERVHLFQQEKYCPEELKEAVSTLIYASTRCGDFPELQQIREIFASLFGKDFAARAIELRNNCGVNPKIIQKLSTRMPSLEDKMKVLKEIASENNINLLIEETVSETTMENSSKENLPIHSEGIERGQVRRKYRDVADAAQAAFESAAYAAAAARAAVELSRSESTDPDNPSRPNPSQRKASTTTIESVKTKLQTHGKDSLENDDQMRSDMKHEKIHPVLETDHHRSSHFLDSSSDLLDDNVNGVGMCCDEEGIVKGREAVFDESDCEDERKSWKHKNDVVGGNMEQGQGVEPLNINRRPISVRTRWARGR